MLMPSLDGPALDGALAAALYVVTSVHAALLAASKSLSFFFRLLLLLVAVAVAVAAAAARPVHPRFLASATFLAADLSARLARLLRLGTRREKMLLLPPLEVAGDAGAGGRTPPTREGEPPLTSTSSRSAAGRRTVGCVRGRGWRGTGANMGVSARAPEMRRSGGSKAPETPRGVLMMRGMSPSCGAGDPCGPWMVAGELNC